MTYHDDERYGLALRHEDYLTYWRRERPQVFIGETDEDQQLKTYLSENSFTEVLPNLWMTPALQQ